MPKMREFPDSWAEDDLTQFVDSAINNIVTTHVRNGVEYPSVTELDSIYATAVKNLLNPQSLIEAVLMMRAHTSFRSATILATAGLNPDAFVQTRNCLETSLYALHMNTHEDTQEVWLRRHDDPRALKAARAEFAFGRVIETLEMQDPPNATVTRLLYERTIDFGAHPNERAVTANLEIQEDGQRVSLRQTTLAGGTLTQRHSLKTLAQAGLSSLYMFRRIFRERFDLLGLTPRLDSLRQRL